MSSTSTSTIANDSGEVRNAKDTSNAELARLSTIANDSGEVRNPSDASRLKALADAFLQIATTGDVDARLQAITEQARQIIGAHQAVTSMTVGPDWSHALTAVSLTDKYSLWHGYRARPDGSGIYAEVCRSRRPMRLTQADLEAHPAWRGFSGHADNHPPLRGWLAAPLIGRNGQSLGLIQLSDKYEGEFSPEDEATLIQFAQYASSFIEAANAQQSSRDSERRFRALADMIPQIVWSTRADGYHDYFNDRWYEYTGLPRPGEPGSENQGWNWTLHLHPEDLAHTGELWNHSLQTGEAYSVEHRFRRCDGVYRWFISRAHPLKDEAGRITRWFGTCTDIEEQKIAQEEREALLRSERAARAEAERATHIKDEFVATLSHELRTPLSAIIGWTQILQKHASDPQTLTRGLEVIDRNARVQAQMIEDLLDMSRILSGKMRIETQRIDPAAVIEAAIASVQPSADAKNIRVTSVLGRAGDVLGDPARLQQVVWNLLSNAIKFTPKGGHVRVFLCKEDSYIEIAVSDSGVGIKAEFLPYVFDRFRQADASTTRRYGGLGLGLSIVKSLVQLHGGTIDVTSPGDGQGATFTVRLPLIAVHQPEPGAGNAVIDQLGGYPALDNVNVLVVDDEPDAREFIARILTDCGAQVTTAGSAAEAIEIFGAHRPDVIVSDIGMPVQDGYELIRRLRAMGGDKFVPAAALTALARSEDRRRALLAGFQTHVAKPVDSSELIAVVASLAGRTGV